MLNLGSLKGPSGQEELVGMIFLFQYLIDNTERGHLKLFATYPAQGTERGSRLDKYRCRVPNLRPL